MNISPPCYGATYDDFRVENVSALSDDDKQTLSKIRVFHRMKCEKFLTQNKPLREILERLYVHIFSNMPDDPITEAAAFLSNIVPDKTLDTPKATSHEAKEEQTYLPPMLSNERNDRLATFLLETQINKKTDSLVTEEAQDSLGALFSGQKQDWDQFTKMLDLG